MPRIPRYEGPHVPMTTQGPGTLVDVNTFAMEGKAAAENWKKVGKVGEALTEVGLEFQKQMRGAEQVHELNGLNWEAREQLADLEKMVYEYEDPKELVPAFKQGAQDWYANRAQSISDPQVRAVFERSWEKKFWPALKSVESEAHKRKINIFFGDAVSSIDKAAKLWVNAKDDFERASIQSDLWGVLNGGVAAGYIHPAKVEELKQKFGIAVKLGRAQKDAMEDPWAFKEQIGGYGLDAAETDKLTGFADRQIHRRQNERYNGYMRAILGQAGETGGDTSRLPSLEQVKGDIEAGVLDPRQGRDVLAYVQGIKGNPQQKTDPQSYKEAVTRFTDPDDPLTREEFLANVESGDWKFDAQTYGRFLVNIANRGTKLEKATESAFKSRIGFWKTQFGGDRQNEQLMTALGQAQAAKDAGELGETREEIEKNLDAIFEPQHKLYMQEWGMGSFKPQPKAKKSWWDWVPGVGGGSKPGPAPAPGKGAPETVTKNGRRYRVLTINGRKMVDTTPLP